MAVSGSLPILVDEALQSEGVNFRLDADHGGGDRRRPQAQLAHLIGTEAWAGLAGAALPVGMNGLDHLQTDVHGTIDRGAGLRKDADDAEGLVVVILPRQSADAVLGDDWIVQPITQVGGDIRADHRVEEIAEGFSGREGQRLTVAIAIVLEVIGCGPQHPEAPVAVAEGEGHYPRDLRPGADVVEALHGDVARGVADAEDGIEQELHVASACANDQIGTRNRVGETGLGADSNALDAEEECHAQGDRENRQQSRQAAIPQR